MTARGAGANAKTAPSVVKSTVDFMFFILLEGGDGGDRVTCCYILNWLSNIVGSTR